MHKLTSVTLQVMSRTTNILPVLPPPFSQDMKITCFSEASRGVRVVSGRGVVTGPDQKLVVARERS